MTKRQDKNSKDIITEKYEPKKKQNREMVKFIGNHLSDKGLERFKDCATTNLFIATEDKETHKLVQSNSCKNRFCPICTYKKARKDALMLSVMMQAIQTELDYDFLFLTLTTPNVKAENLIDEISLFNTSFKKLMKRKEFQAINKGYVRKLELTYNAERNDYNPHFHVIIAVRKSYFQKAYYISQEKWLANWREVTGKTGFVDGHDEITQLHIKKVRQGYGKRSAISEVAKYSAKDSEMVTNKNVFDTMYKALKGRQLITFNGIFKDYRKKFEQGELDDYKELDKNNYYWKLFAEWNLNRYERTYSVLTEQEKEKYLGQKIEEEEIE